MTQLTNRKLCPRVTMTSRKGVLYSLSLSVIFITLHHLTTEHLLSSDIEMVLSDAEVPFEVGGVLRWKERPAPKGSVRESSVYQKVLQYDDTMAKAKYVKRWTNLTIPNRSTEGPKTILYYNDFIENNEFFFGEGREPFIRAGCPFSNCFATHNRSLVKPRDADAIVWHQRSVNTLLPRKISPHTRMVYFMMESQDYVLLNLWPYGNIFNYTMSFSEHSDIYNPYGHIVKKKNPVKNVEKINHAAGKSKMAVWFASHCRTKSFRESVVEKLKEYIDVDIFGTCGPYKCRKIKFMNPESCFRKVESIYKFYFSFENSLCKNYVTEKFFRAAQYDMLPVVYGIGPYDTMAPPKSYIDALDFKNVKELADYLIYLDKNDTAYNEYFSWKEDYESLCFYKEHKPPSYNKISWCQLCEKLHTDVTPQTYTELYPFHGPQSHCLSAKSAVMRQYMYGEEKKQYTRKKYIEVERLS